MATVTSAQLSAITGCQLRLNWRHARFYQSLSKGGYVLHGFPVSYQAYVNHRLTVQGASIISSGRAIDNAALAWVHFSGSPQLAAKLALLFAAPKGATPLFITGKASIGKRMGARTVRQFVL